MLSPGPKDPCVVAVVPHGARGLGARAARAAAPARALAGRRAAPRRRRERARQPRARARFVKRFVNKPYLCTVCERASDLSYGKTRHFAANLKALQRFIHTPEVSNLKFYCGGNSEIRLQTIGETCTASRNRWPGA